MGKETGLLSERYDIIIIGGGPAGLTAGIYAARGRMKTLLIESFSVMGQATMTEMIENYPGVEKSGGFELISIFKRQAEKFGMKSRSGTVEKIAFKEDGGIRVWQVTDEDGVTEALSVIIASGAKAKKLSVPGEDEMIGKGVSYCATCDGAFFKNKNIVVVGGGDTAVEEALYLTRFGDKVSLIHRRDRLRAAKILQERVESNEKMSFIWKSVVKRINGTDKVVSVTVKDVDTGEEKDVPCDGVFIFAGWEPNTGFLEGAVETEEKGGIKVDAAMKTSAEGVFAAGDCCYKVLHQVVTACGDGATAAFSSQNYVERLKGTEYK
ncbi:MAG: thioredoxin-disulfide reductase [Candidatus Omnitrophota bacterium]|nr:thioredoxin-disulfide reductase [Candidatus Omnitrophota bacterium]